MLQRITRVRALLGAACLAAGLAGSLPCAAADAPQPRQGDWMVRDFRFHTGEVAARAEAALHHGRRADRRAGADPARHRRLGRRHARARRSPASCSAPASRSTRARYYIILPDAIGTGKSSQALRRPAREVPALQLRRHGRRAVPAGHRAPGRARTCAWSSAIRWAACRPGSGAQKYPGLHGRAGADGLAADRDVRPQLDDAAPDHRLDPQRPRVERRQLHRSSRAARSSPRCSSASPPTAATRRCTRPRRRARRPTRCSTDAPDARRSRPMPTTSSTSGIRRATTTPSPRPGAHPGDGAGHQRGRRRAQSARARRHGPRNQAGEERPGAADPGQREDRRPRHHRAGEVLEGGAGRPAADRAAACALARNEHARLHPQAPAADDSDAARRPG